MAALPGFLCTWNCSEMSYYWLHRSPVRTTLGKYQLARIQVVSQYHKLHISGVPWDMSPETDNLCSEMFLSWKYKKHCLGAFTKKTPAWSKLGMEESTWKYKVKCLPSACSSVVHFSVDRGNTTLLPVRLLCACLSDPFASTVNITVECAYVSSSYCFPG